MFLTKLVEKEKDGDYQMIDNENFTLLHIYNILVVYGFAPLVGITIGCIIVSLRCVLSFINDMVKYTKPQGN